MLFQRKVGGGTPSAAPTATAIFPRPKAGEPQRGNAPRSGSAKLKFTNTTPRGFAAPIAAALEDLLPAAPRRFSTHPAKQLPARGPSRRDSSSQAQAHADGSIVNRKHRRLRSPPPRSGPLQSRRGD